MSLEFIDGFDHYTASAMVGRKWDSNSSFSLVSGRFGGNAASQVNSTWQLSNANAFTSLTNQVTRVVGWALYCGSNSPWASSQEILIAFRDVITTQVDLRVNTTGNLYVTRNGTTIGTTSTQSLVQGGWQYIEMSATIGSSGSVTVKVGGVTWISITGTNTQASSNAYSNCIQFPGTNGFGPNIYVDDLYILNSQGSVNNTFLGECRIYTSEPSADDTASPSTNLLWTPNSGTAHYSRVNESNPDDDTSYVSSSTVGQIDTYSMPSISPSGAILGVQSVATARKDDVGVRSIALEYRGGGANYSGTNQPLNSNYFMLKQMYETDPATGAAWTTSGVNNGEFGVNLTA